MRRRQYISGSCTRTASRKLCHFLPECPKNEEFIQYTCAILYYYNISNISCHIMFGRLLAKASST